jgi:putative transposase
MDKLTHTIRDSRWKEIILQCQNRPAGMSAKQWIAENQISEKSYYYRLRKFRKEAYEQMNNTQAVLPVAKAKSFVFRNRKNPFLKLCMKRSSRLP